MLAAAYHLLSSVFQPVGQICILEREIGQDRIIWFGHYINLFCQDLKLNLPTIFFNLNSYVDPVCAPHNFPKIHEENQLLAAVKNSAHEQKLNDAG